MSQQPLTLVLTNAQTLRMAMSPGNVVAVWCGVARSALRLISLLAPGPRSGAHYLRPTPPPAHLPWSEPSPTCNESKNRPYPCPPRSYQPERSPSSTASAHVLFTWAERAAGLALPDPVPPTWEPLRDLHLYLTQGWRSQPPRHPEASFGCWAIRPGTCTEAWLSFHVIENPPHQREHPRSAALSSLASDH